MFINMQLKKKGTPKKYKHTRKAIRIRRGKEARVEEPNHGRSPREVWSNRLYWTVCHCQGCEISTRQA